MAMTQPTEKTADLLAAVLADLATVISGVTAGQFHDPTPCTGWDVQQLRDHALGWLAIFAAGFADPDGRAPRTSADGYTAPADAAGAAAEVRAASDTLIAAVRGGAASRPLWLGDSAMPGDMALSMILWEYLMHGWDLAQATGQPWSPPSAAAQESLNFAPAMLTDDYQGQDKPFGIRVQVPETAPPFDQLLGLSGRDPGWRQSAVAQALIARFRVDSFEPRHVPGIDGGWAGVMVFAKTFTAGITGEATTLFMSAGQEEGNRSYVATERITGHTDDGRKGSVIVQHGGLESDPGTWFGHIVPGSGTGDFAGWAGSARIIHDEQGPYFEIRLS
jgi:uncharacterized protein (TIGR03086 family)